MLDTELSQTDKEEYVQVEEWRSFCEYCVSKRRIAGLKFERISLAQIQPCVSKEGVRQPAAVPGSPFPSFILLLSSQVFITCLVFAVGLATMFY